MMNKMSSMQKREDLEKFQFQQFADIAVCLIVEILLRDFLNKKCCLLFCRQIAGRYAFAPSVPGDFQCYILIFR